MDKDWAIELIDRAVRKRNFDHLADLIRKSDLAPEVRDYLATVVLGLLTGKIKLPAHRPKSREDWMGGERDRKTGADAQ